MTRQHQKRGERILQTPRELLAERGYSEITIRELADRCGVSVPTLYNRFGGKDELIGEAVRNQFSRALRSVEDAGEPIGHQRLIALVGRVADGARRVVARCESENSARAGEASAGRDCYRATASGRREGEEKSGNRLSSNRYFGRSSTFHQGDIENSMAFS